MRQLLVVVWAAVVLSGCAGLSDQDRRVLAGGTVGAGIGAAIGSAAGGPTGTWVGAAVGGATGSAIGYLIRPDGCYYRNRRGELWQVPCERRIVKAATCYAGNEIAGLREVPCPHGYRL